jgi:PHD/YefM family antitoxin component YafN of YafNO toxin-antitoxin module
MKTLTVAEACKRFDALLDAVQLEPVLIRLRNGNKVMMISAEKYKRMCSITSFEPEPLKVRRANPSKSR